MNKLHQLLIKHEGMELRPYTDTVGKTTIGVGRNLSDIGISENEALILLANDIKRAQVEANQFSWFKNLDGVRQEVLVMMLFNLGLPRFKEFKKLIKALQESDYINASDEMLDSDWAEQVGARATELALMMETGEYADED